MQRGKSYAVHTEQTSLCSVMSVMQVSDELTNTLTSISMTPSSSLSSSSKKLKATAAAEVGDVKLDAVFVFPQCHIRLFTPSVTVSILALLSVDNLTLVNCNCPLVQRCMISVAV